MATPKRLSPEGLEETLRHVAAALGHGAADDLRAHLAAQGVEEARRLGEFDKTNEACREAEDRLVRMEQHVSDLEKSLENARKERVEDSPRAFQAGYENHVEALRKAERERDEAVADNARLLEALAIATRGRIEREPGNAPGHAHSIPGVWDDDNGARSGTSCEWCRIEWPKVLRAQQLPHSGAALLEEHRKALVRARNEGLERAAERMAKRCINPASSSCRCMAHEDARALRAMKEPE